MGQRFQVLEASASATLTVGRTDCPFSISANRLVAIKIERFMPRSALIGLRAVLLIVLSHVVAIALFPADPMSVYIGTATIVPLVLVAFWVGLRTGVAPVESNHSVADSPSGNDA